MTDKTNIPENIWLEPLKGNWRHDYNCSLEKEDNAKLSIPKYEYILKSVADKNTRDRIEELEKTFKHFHVNNQEDNFCKECGLYLTDDIHIRAEGDIK